MIVSNRGGGGVSLPDLRDFDALRDVFAGALASQLSPASLTVEKQPCWVSGQIVSANFFELLA